jgi:hypothetical protein
MIYYWRYQKDGFRKNNARNVRYDSDIDIVVVLFKNFFFGNQMEKTKRKPGKEKTHFGYQECLPTKKIQT